MFISLVSKSWMPASIHGIVDVRPSLSQPLKVSAAFEFPFESIVSVERRIITLTSGRGLSLRMADLFGLKGVIKALIFELVSNAETDTLSFSIRFYYPSVLGSWQHPCPERGVSGHSPILLAR